MDYNERINILNRYLFLLLLVRGFLLEHVFQRYDYIKLGKKIKFEKRGWERKAEDRSLGGGNYFLVFLIRTQTARIVTAPIDPMIIEELMSAVMNALADEGEFIGNTEKIGS